MENPVSIFGKANDGQSYPIGVGAPVSAAQTLTLVANPSNLDTFTVGGKTYTFQTSLTNVANNVKIGATASDSIDNAIAAINRTSGDGTTYAAATPVNANVSAAAGAGDTMVVTARKPGYAGNALATTETFTNAGNVWGAATLAGGTEATVSMSGTVSITEPSGTFHPFAKTAGQTETIPAGAFDGGVIFLTGTGTVGGIDLPAGTPWNFASKLVAPVDVVCANPGTARIFYFT